jgi:hypothetical protein
MRETARLRKLLAELGTDNVKSEGTTNNDIQQLTPDIRHPKTRNQQQTKIHFITEVYTEYTPIHPLSNISRSTSPQHTLPPFPPSITRGREGYVVFVLYQYLLSILWNGMFM